MIDRHVAVEPALQCAKKLFFFLPQKIFAASSVRSGDESGGARGVFEGVYVGRASRPQTLLVGSPLYSYRRVYTVEYTNHK